MLLAVTDRYLWLPVDENAPLVRLHLYHGDQKIDEIHIHLSNGQGVYYACKDMTDYLHKEIEVIRYDERPVHMLFFMDHKPENVYHFRPQIHFSPDNGYLLDPNGLIYQDGVYHLYHQYNPYGTEWNNMHWGHGTSRDLIHWKNEDIFMYPDQYGPCFSGSAIIDHQNLLGFGADAIVYFYTAAGGKNEWSRTKGFTCRQKMKISTDGGMTCFDDPRFCMEQMADLNRDPFVFYHEESHAYIMVLFLIGYQFTIFRSTDLIHWDQTQILEFPGAWECPNLFYLPFKGTGKWVFWTVEGYYVLGSFDGYEFHAETSMLQGFSAKGLHAMQIFSGVPDRVVALSCIAGSGNTKGHYCGSMSIPCELSLTEKKEGPRLSFQPVQELYDLANWQELPLGTIVSKLSLNGKPYLLRLHYHNPSGGSTFLELENLNFEFDFSSQKVTVTDILQKKTLMRRSFSEDLSCKEITLLIDQEIAELFLEDGTVYAAFSTTEDVLHSRIVLKSEIPVTHIQWTNIN